jgi:tetratricopeptide (TPR) repeat protein
MEHSQSRTTDNLGLARLNTYCAKHKPQLTWDEKHKNDIGIDGEIELYDEKGKPYAKLIKVQLKSTLTDGSYIKNENEKTQTFTFYAEKNHVEYWQKVENDVLLIIYDGRNGEEKLYAKRIEDIDLESIKTKSVPIEFNKITDLIDEKDCDFIERFLNPNKKLGKLLPNFFIPDLKYFVGRVDLLKNVEAELKTSHRVSIHDISGLGKTFSTLEFARRYQNNYDKLFFINASKEGYLESLANCGELLEPSVKSVREQLVKVNAFKNWLEKNDNWLVIFDNVDIAADIKPFVPANLNGDCLFTSNFRDICRFTTEVKITKLDDIDSKILLYSISNAVPLQKPDISDQKEVAAFDKIIEEIDGLPISLTTTGAFIFKKESSFAEYLERLKDEPEIILNAEDDFGIYHKKSALKAFSIAFVENTDTTNADAQQKLYAEAVKMLYFAASFLAPDEIHEEFLRKFLETYFEPFQTSEKKTSFWQDVRAKFTEYDLFKFNQTDKTFRTHRLIQKTIQTKLNADEKKTICEQVLELLKDYFPEYDYNNKEQCERYYQHTVSALENADKLFESEDSGSLYFRLGRYQVLSGSYQFAQIYHQKSLAISQKVYGKNHKETATDLNDLASVYLLQSKYDEAIKLFLEAIEIGKNSIGIKHPHYATYLNQLASVYEAQGKYEEAIKLLLEAIEIGKKTIGIEHPDYAKRLNNLAVVYKLQGKYDEAIKLCLEAIEIAKKTIGIEHPNYAIYLNMLATVYDSQGKYDEAIKLYLEAKDITGKTVGIEHPAYAVRLNNLAIVYYSQGKYQDALPLYEEALRILEAKLPETHPNIQIVRKGLMLCKQKLSES